MTTIPSRKYLDVEKKALPSTIPYIRQRDQRRKAARAHALSADESAEREEQGSL
jgi:hypothetical protein